MSFITVEAPLWIADSISPTGEIFPNHTDWSIRFDKQVNERKLYNYYSHFNSSSPTMAS